MKHILIIEDDPDIRELISYNLTREGFKVSCSADGQDGLAKALSSNIDLLVLDLMLPRLNGIEVCKKLRQTPATRDLPIIMLTAKGDQSDIVFGLGIGADDYMVKPFGIKELVARVYTRLRTQTPIPEQTAELKIIRHGQVEIDRARFQIKVCDQLIVMTLAEFRLFEALVARPGIVLSRDQLLEAVTGGEGIVIDRNIDVHIRSIRKKLGESRDLILTVRGIGYKFKEIS